MLRPPPISTLFPYTTLFRSCGCSPASNATSEPTARSTSPTIASRRSISWRSEEHTSELQSLTKLVCRLLLEKKKPQTGRRTARAPDPLLIGGPDGLHRVHRL